MTSTPDKARYLAWAAKARDQSEEATTPAARALHLGIAAEYDAKAAAEPAADAAPRDKAPPSDGA